MGHEGAGDVDATGERTLHFRAKSIFMQSLEHEPERRAAFLDASCGDDAALRASVEALLAADAAFAAGDGAGDALPAERVGRYRLIRPIASGGNGTVYEAEQEHPHRRVALKIMRAALAAPGLMRRFTAETEILARLEHPNIARIYEAGWHDSGLGGVPWFAMELVHDARWLTEHAEAEGLGVRKRLELFARVCDAVQYGHQRGFIHRDLKPANILVDGAGQPRIIDFGVARATDADMTLATMHTKSSEIVGTLRYMSPEQCSGDSANVDTRTDVYSLGVVLCELLTGSLPYDLTTATSVFDVPRIIRDQPPRRPAALDRRLRGDLDTIILKCLEKSPERRYDSVSALADDVRRHLAGEPIAARRDSSLYVLGRLVARHRTAAVTAAAVLLLLVGAVVALAVLFGRAESARILAENRAEDLRRRDYFNAIALARTSLDDGNVPGALSLLDGCAEDLRGWEWRHLRGRTDDSVRVHETAPLLGAVSAWQAINGQLGFAVTADGTLAAVGADDGTIHLWDMAADRVVRTLRGHNHSTPAMAFSADGTRLASREGQDRARFRVWDVASGRVLLEGEVGDAGGVIGLSGDGGRCYVVDRAELVAWEVDDATIVGRLPGPPNVVTAIALAADDTLVATGGHDGVARLWSAATFEQVDAVGGNGPWVSALAFGPDGRTLAIGTSAGAVREYDLAARSVSRVFDQRADGVRHLAWSPDGALLSVAQLGVIEVRDAGSGERLARLHAGGLITVDAAMGVFVPGGRRLVAGGADGNLREFDLDGPRAAFVAGRHDGYVDLVAASPDGRWAASAGRDRIIRLYELPSGAAAGQWPAHARGRRIDALAFSPDSHVLASSGAEPTLMLWSVPDGEALLAAPLEASALSIAWAGDGRALAVGAADGAVELWDADSGGLLDRFNPGDEPPRADIDWYRWRFPRVVAFSPDGRLLATSGHEGRIWLWRWPLRTLIASWPAHDALVRDLSFSPDGTRLASCGDDGVIRTWSVVDGRQVRELEAHVLGVSFSPDGRRLLSHALSAELIVWDPDRGVPVLALTGHMGSIPDAAFSGDGQCVVSGGTDGTVRLWRAVSR